MKTWPFRKIIFIFSKYSLFSYTTKILIKKKFFFKFTNCAEPIDVNKRLNELRLINLHYDTNYRFEFAAHTGGGMGLLNSVDAHTLPEALHLNSRSFFK